MAHITIIRGARRSGKSYLANALLSVAQGSPDLYDASTSRELNRERFPAWAARTMRGMSRSHNVIITAHEDDYQFMVDWIVNNVPGHTMHYIDIR